MWGSSQLTSNAGLTFFYTSINKNVLRIGFTIVVILQILHATEEMNSENRFNPDSIRYMGFGKRSSSEEFGDDQLIGKGFRMGFGKRSPMDATNLHMGFGKRRDAYDGLENFHMGFGKRAVDMDTSQGDEYMRGFRMGFGKRDSTFADSEWNPRLQQFSLGFGRR